MKHFNTPWGVADQVHSLHPDKKILRVCTPEHGGIAVALDLQMPACLAALGMEEGGYRWFEEDEAWAAPATAFPTFFHPDHVRGAKETLQHRYPEAFMAHFGGVLTAATSRALERREWEAATAGNFTVTSGFGDWDWNVPTGYVYACGWRKNDEATAGFLVPADIYDVNPARLVLDDFPRWEPDRTLPYSKPQTRACTGGGVSEPVLQAGRLACLAVASALAASQPAQGAPVYLRAIAHDLERTLMKDPECSVHWVAVIDETDTFGPPKRVWEFDDHLLQVSLAHGHSEGMLVYVYAQADRYKPGELVPLLRIKLLCGLERALREMQAIWTYLNDSPEFVKAKTQP